MPVIRCPYCRLRQYAPATHASLAECASCGRRFEVRRATLIAPVMAAERKVRNRLRRTIAGDRR
jgi:DNA-directed RNA polymerase subunit RPC12/RpoP